MGKKPVYLGGNAAAGASFGTAGAASEISSTMLMPALRSSSVTTSRLSLVKLLFYLHRFLLFIEHNLANPIDAASLTQRNHSRFCRVQFVSIQNIKIGRHQVIITSRDRLYQDAYPQEAPSLQMGKVVQNFR